jgi:hypothetical protein
MDTIKKWLAKYNLTTHTIVAASVFLIGAFYAVTPFHDLVMAIYNQTPAWAHTVVSVGIALYAWYRQGKPSTDAKSSTDNTKLGAVALIMLTLLGTMPIMGCDGNKVAQDIVNWTPALQSAVTVVDTSAAVLDPAAAPIFTAATVAFDAASNELVAQAKAYLASPKDATTLARLQTAVATFQQTVNTALLEAVKISNPASQQHALNAINAVAVVVNTMLALVSSISSKTAVAAMSQQVPTKLADVRQTINTYNAVRTIAAHYNEPIFVANVQFAMADASLTRSGF